MNSFYRNLEAGGRLRLGCSSMGYARMGRPPRNVSVFAELVCAVVGSRYVTSTPGWISQASGCLRSKSRKNRTDHPGNAGYGPDARPDYPEFPGRFPAVLPHGFLLPRRFPEKKKAPAKIG